MIEKAQHILRSVFGYNGFISLQRDIIENVLRGKDTLAVMPTGGGKSLCYQIPALLFDGLTIVVSPLISLMKDQVEQLAEVKVPAVLLNSSLSPWEYRDNVERIQRGEAKLLYLAPETLLKPDMLALLESIPVSCLAIDEAHCISDWGPDFRPEYRQLVDVRPHLPGAVCMALTATATPRVRVDIKTCLGFDDSSEFVAGFNRENLFIGVAPKNDPLRQAIEFLSRFPLESGIIYCLTRQQVDNLCTELQSRGFSICPYHAGLSEVERNRNQERFIRDEARIIVATVAFGMGINKSNIRFVLHYDLPKNIEGYYQEIGRAGRDGMRADCLLLFSYADIYKIKAFINKKEGQEKRAANLQLNAMVRFAESDVCRRAPLLSYFGETSPSPKCGMCDNCRTGEREMSDFTIPAQMFLSCVKRTGERFGIVHTIDVLRGSRASKVLKFGHDKLSTYGIGKEYSKDEWQQLARQFLHKELLVQDPELGGLCLTPKAWEVMRGKDVFLGRLESRTNPEGAKGNSAPNQASDYDRELFEALRRKRKELADAANIPPYVVFSDKTLAEMATRLPRDAESMLAVHGVGMAKLEKYGPIFTEVINDYCRDHPADIKLPAPIGKPSPEKPETGQKKRRHSVGEAFNAGQSVEEIAQELNIQRSTVLDHLYRYHQEGCPLRPGEELLRLVTIPPDGLERATDAFKRHGYRFLRPVFDELNGEIGYDDLRIICLYCLSMGNADDRTLDSASRQGVHAGRIICLANSRKNHPGRCVAGKEWRQGRAGGWIRPVSREGTGELSVCATTMQNGKVPGLLDIITIFLGEACPHDYQSENHFVADKPWIWEGAIPLSQAEQLCDAVDHLWINGYHSLNGLNDRMPLNLVTGSLSSSLLFIRPDSLCIIVGKDLKGLKKARAKFIYNGETYRLPVTDPIVEADYMRRDVGSYPVEQTQPYVTVSISEPFEGFCYKLAAGVIL
jgi:ATP-dependent DNA helicase RecQ